jgi:stage II sporulation protein M
VSLKEGLLQIRQLKHYIIAATFVFVLGIILGYSNSDAFHTLLTAQIDHMQGIANGIKQSDHRQWSLFFTIFMNNMLASAMTILFGVFFGIFPLYFLISNGLMLGYIATDHTKGQTVLFYLKAILPHGIIEIPAIILACAFGLRFGFLMVEGLWSLLNIERRILFSLKFHAFFRSLVPVGGIVTVMMLVAAIIESTVSYSLLK